MEAMKIRKLGDCFATLAMTAFDRLRLTDRIKKRLSCIGRDKREGRRVTPKYKQLNPIRFFVSLRMTSRRN
jgi:hypothetical protein